MGGMRLGLGCSFCRIGGRVEGEFGFEGWLGSEFGMDWLLVM